MSTNFQRTAAWLAACGKQPNPLDLSVQIGVHIEEFTEFLADIDIDDPAVAAYQVVALDLLDKISANIKRRNAHALIDPQRRVDILDSLCDQEVTLNGVAYLAGFRKDEADHEVLSSNEAKLVNGKPVILEGGKIGKPEGWQPPNLGPFA